MKIEYTLKRDAGIDKGLIKTCDAGFKAMQSMLVRTAWLTNKPLTPLMWILTRFYKRTISKDKISYDFFLLKG